MSMSLRRWFGVSLAIGVGLFLGLAGCRNQDGKDAKSDAQADAKKDNDGKPILGRAVTFAKPSQLVPFKDAVIIDPAPEGEQRPPDMSCNGKKLAKIFDAIANEHWDKVNFKDATGHTAGYRAIMTTDLGEIHIDLLGDVAPNHVRSFVSLVWAGYYDGMQFYYTFNHEVEGQKVSWIESGCPKGTGENGYGSVGYWLRPEFSDKVTHAAGTLGACLREADDTGACRFYITAVPLPRMDGQFTAFGKVTKGLDIVTAISTRPADELDRPTNPVSIRSVRIETVRE